MMIMIKSDFVEITQYEMQNVSWSPYFFKGVPKVMQKFFFTCGYYTAHAVIVQAVENNR